jgi:hypothetical protein
LLFGYTSNPYCAPVGLEVMAAVSATLPVTPPLQN